MATNPEGGPPASSSSRLSVDGSGSPGSPSPAGSGRSRLAAHAEGGGSASPLRSRLSMERSPTPSRSPRGSLLQIPSPIITKRTRTASTSARAYKNPVEKGMVKSFSRSRGHGFIKPHEGGEDIFVHISDIEGEYVPMAGDEVKYRLCIIPPKCEKHQAVCVQIIHFCEVKHKRWEDPAEKD